MDWNSNGLTSMKGRDARHKPTGYLSLIRDMLCSAGSLLNLPSCWRKKAGRGRGPKSNVKSRTSTEHFQGTAPSAGSSTLLQVAVNCINLRPIT